METNTNTTNNQTLLTKRVNAGKRTFWLDVKMSKANKPYLALTESKKNDEGDNEYTNLYIFADQLADFTKAINEVAEFVADFKEEEVAEFVETAKKKK